MDGWFQYYKGGQGLATFGATLWDAAQDFIVEVSQHIFNYSTCNFSWAWWSAVCKNQKQHEHKLKLQPSGGPQMLFMNQTEFTLSRTETHTHVRLMWPLQWVCNTPMGFFHHPPIELNWKRKGSRVWLNCSKHKQCQHTFLCCFSQVLDAYTHPQLPQIMWAFRALKAHTHTHTHINSITSILRF